MKKYMVFAAALYSVSSWAGLDCSKGGRDRNNGCKPVVFVIRHAEDTDSVPHDLTPVGKKHAELYVNLFDKYIYGEGHSFNNQDKCVCPIKKIIAISDLQEQANNPNPKPSPNPYKTIVDVEKNLGLNAIKGNDKTQYWSTFQWDRGAKLSLFDGMGDLAPFSALISWDMQGLNPPEDKYNELMQWLKAPQKYLKYHDYIPLLKFFPKVIPQNEKMMTPSKTFLWVYSNQDSADGKFNQVKVYQQYFYKDEGCQYLDVKDGVDPSINSKCIKLKSIK